MNTDVMKEVLEKLNAKLKRKGRKILLLMDNAPCHPHNLADTFSNITIKFLPKNTTSMYYCQLESYVQKETSLLCVLQSRWKKEC